MGRNNVNDINFSFCVMTCFVKTLVLNDVNKMGQQVQIHFKFFWKNPKTFESKVEDPWTPSKQFENPQI